MSSTGKHRLFRNRRDAGEQLGKYLKSKYEKQNPLIVGIPRGGIEVGYYVADILDAEFTLIVSKKLSFPENKELGFGAVTEEAGVYVSAIGRELFDPILIQDIIEEQLIEVERRVRIYRRGKPLPEMKGRIVILVDDGIATGVTMVPVIRLCHKKEAAKVIVAAPVSGRNYDAHLQEADIVEVLQQPEDFYGVGQAYERFGDFTDKEVLSLLKSF